MTAIHPPGTKLALTHGSVWAWVVPGYAVECNAYCRDGLHCEVFYTADVVVDEAELLKTVQLDFGRKIVRIERASHEAPPAAGPLITVGNPDAPDGTEAAWLMFWK